LTTICRAELACVSERSPIVTTIGVGAFGVRPVVELVVGADERVRDEDGRAEPPLGPISRWVPEPPTVKLRPGTLGRVLLDAGVVGKGMASTTPGLRSPSVPEGKPASAEPPGMKPSTATPVRVSEDTAATAAAGAPDRTVSEAVAARWWRAARDVARRLMSSSRSVCAGLIGVTRSAAVLLAGLLVPRSARCSAPHNGGVGRSPVRLEPFFW
jgi:hypothetical protein